MEISKLMDQFLEANNNIGLEATVIWKHIRELGLIVPPKYMAMITDIVNANVLDKKLQEKNEKCKHFEMKYEPLTAFKKKTYY